MESLDMSQNYPELFKLFQLTDTRFDDDLKTVRFYSHTKEFPFQSPQGIKHWQTLGVLTTVFSNLKDNKIHIPDVDGHFLSKYEDFKSTEHYFQMYKYPDADRNFMQNLSGSDVASYGQRRLKLQNKHIKDLNQLEANGHQVPTMKNGRRYEVGSGAEPQLIVDNWEEKGIDVMLTALRAKFSQHQNLTDMLVATKGCWLIEHTKNDKKWADGLSGEGTNYLGKLLMYVRQEVLDKKEYTIDRGFLKTSMKNLIKY